MSESAMQGPFSPRVFHPLGVIRVVTPEEEAAIHGRAVSGVPASARRQDSVRQSIRPAIGRAVRALRSFGRVWVEAQVHKGGI
jgi:hypothetical protein